MHSKYRQFLAALFVFIFICGLPGFCLAAGSGVHWFSYKEGLKKMKQENKKGFLHFYTDWCTYCKLMKKQTFSNAKVINYMNKHYIAIRVNAEDQTAKKIVKDYGVDRFPLNFFLQKDASVIGERPGYVPPDTFISMLKFIDTNSYKTESFTDYLKQQK